MKYAVEMGPGAMTDMPSSDIEKLRVWGDS
jgi:hypothetical protein